MARSKRWAVAALLTTATLMACGDDDDDSTGAAGSPGASGSPGAGAEDQIYPTPVSDTLASLAGTGPGWHTLSPGGATVCSKGTPFLFFVRPGATDRVVVEFSGGGACWNDKTCTLASQASLFSETAETPDYVTDETKAKGISNHGRDDNPVKDWTHVFISYCTGDLHVGDNDKVYTDPADATKTTTINHRGATNTRAALSWVFANFTTPSKVLVTGCSAGGYGATFWAPHIQRHYPQSHVYHVSDSAAGIVSPAFFGEINESWKPQSVYPSYIPGSDPSVTAKLSSFYTAVGNFFPQMPLSQLNSQADGTQSLYYGVVTGEDPAGWSPLMLGEMSAIHAGTTNFSSYLTPGSKHCVLVDDDFYGAPDGKAISSWVGDLVNDTKPADLACPDCK